MALSRTEFQDLRDRGLSVDQIMSFESGVTPKPEKEPLRESRPFRDSFTGLAKSVGRAGLGLGTLGRTVQEGVARTVGADLPENSIFDIGSPQREKADEFLAPKSQAEKTSGFVGDVASLALPGGGVYKATKGLGFAMKMLGRGAVGGLGGTVQGGGDIDRDTAIGAAAEIVFPLGGKVLGYGGNVLKGLSGLVSGKGSDVIEQIIKTPQAALEGGAGASSKILRETATEIRGGVREIRKRAGATFEALTKDHTNPLDRKAFDTLTDDFFEEVDSSTFLKPEDISKLKNTILTWTDNSPQGLNKLASKISKFYSGSDAGKDMDSVVSGLNRTIRDWIGEQVPDIAEANSKYSDKMDLIEQMEAIFRTKGAVDGRVGLQKTAESIGRLFNANKDITREGVEEIEKELGINVLGKEAGRQLVDGVSRSQSAIGDFATGVTRALLPPKLLLQVTARTGIAKEAIESRLDVLDPGARAVVVEVLTDLFGEGERQDQ
jgi:hypothetical protein